MASIGNTLREARQSKGLSLAEMEETTKIRTHYLRALEDEKFDLLPGQTYMVGFLRSYARALGLNAQELVEAYKSTQIKEETVLAPVEPVEKSLVSRPGIPRGLLIAGLCILALVTLYGVDSAWKKTTPQAAQGNKNVPAVTQPPPVKQETTPPTAQVPPPQNQPAPSQAPPPVQTFNGLSLDLNFSDTCWISVKADGQKVFEGTLSSGTKNIQAVEKIELTVGNAGGVQLVLNGKALPALGDTGQVVRNKVLTRKDVTP